MLKLCQHLLCAVVMVASLLFIASPATAVVPESAASTSATSEDRPADFDKLWSHSGGAVMVTVLGMMFIAVSLFNLYYLLSRKKIWRRQGRRT